MSTEGSKTKRTRLSVSFTQPFMDGINRLVREGVYLDKGAVIRDAVRILLGYKGISPFYLEGEGCVKAS